MIKETSKTNFLTLIKIGAPIPFAFGTTHIPEIEELCIRSITNCPSFVFYTILVFLALIWALIVLIHRKTKNIKKTQDELVKLQQDLNKSQEALVKSQLELSEVIKPTMVDCSVGSLKACVIHHRTLKTWDRIREAKEEIILHAAYYPKYGYDSDYSNAFRALMRNKHTVNVTVIITDISSQWAKEFGKILRYEYDTIERFEEGISSSIAFFKKLKEEFPNRVTIKTSSRLPLMPFVIIDNDILIGHYCHAEIPAPNGLWLHINSEKITEIIEKVRYESEENRKAYITNLTDEEQAISRYIEDVFDAIKHGKTI